jgi:hypothetical protein
VTLLAEGELLIDTYHFVHPYVASARELLGGPLPSMKTTEYIDADPEVKLACLLVLAEAYIVTDPHQALRRQLRGASLDLHGGDAAYWRGWAANRVEFDELQRLRGARPA